MTIKKCEPVSSMVARKFKVKHPSAETSYLNNIHLGESLRMDVEETKPL